MLVKKAIVGAGSHSKWIVDVGAIVRDYPYWCQKYGVPILPPEEGIIELLKKVKLHELLHWANLKHSPNLGTLKKITFGLGYVHYGNRLE